MTERIQGEREPALVCNKCGRTITGGDHRIKVGMGCNIHVPFPEMYCGGKFEELIVPNREPALTDKQTARSVYPDLDVTYCAHVWEIWDSKAFTGDYAHRMGHSAKSLRAAFAMAAGYAIGAKLPQESKPLPSEPCPICGHDKYLHDVQGEYDTGCKGAEGSCGCLVLIDSKPLPSEAQATEVNLSALDVEKIIKRKNQLYEECNELEDKLAEALEEIERLKLSQLAAKPSEPERNAFYEGCRWWQYHQNNSTIFPSEKDEAFAEAERRYGAADKPSEPACTCPDSPWIGSEVNDSTCQYPHDEVDSEPSEPVGGEQILAASSVCESYREDAAKAEKVVESSVAWPEEKVSDETIKYLASGISGEVRDRDELMAKELQAYRELKKRSDGGVVTT